MRKHFTATAYIVAKFKGEYKVLLHKHKKLNIWIAIGGHVEKDENPVEALQREVLEETNLKIKILNTKKLLKMKQASRFAIEGINEILSPVALVEEDVPSYKDEPFHIHIDLIYFSFCKNLQKIKMNNKYNWFSKNDLKKAKLNKEVLKFATEALDSYVQNLG